MSFNSTAFGGWRCQKDGRRFNKLNRSELCTFQYNTSIPSSPCPLRSRRSWRPRPRPCSPRPSFAHVRRQEQRHVRHQNGEQTHADGEVSGRARGLLLRGRLREPLLDAEEHGGPADDLVAGEDLRGGEYLRDEERGEVEVDEAGWVGRTAAMGRVEVIVLAASCFSGSVLGSL